MSNFQSLIASLGERGFSKGMSTSEGQFLHRDVNGTDEICVHLTESTFPANKPGANIWLQDAHNARPKQREDVLTGSFADFEGEVLDRIVGLEAWAAKTTVQAVCMIQRRLGGMYANMAHPAFPSDAKDPHRDYQRVQNYMDSATLKLVIGGDAKKSEKMPDVIKKVTPGKISKYLDFQTGDTYRGFSSRTRKLHNGELELTVAHVEYFDSVEPSEVIPSEGHTVILFDETTDEVAFRKHLPETGEPFVDQERAYLLAAAVEASRMSFVADGAEFLTSYLSGERVDQDVAEMAFDLVREDQFDALGEGDDELLWAEFADALHEKIHGFSYDMEAVLTPASPAPVMA